MRQRFLAEFDKLWFDCMNGDSRETGKITPDGKPDPSVFSTEYNREGITSWHSGLCYRAERKNVIQSQPSDFVTSGARSKRADLLASLGVKRFDKAYAIAKPRPENRRSFQPESVAVHYTEWPKVINLCAVALQRTRRTQRRRAYFD